MKFREVHDWYSDCGKYWVAKKRPAQFEVHVRGHGSTWFYAGSRKTLAEAKRRCRELAKREWKKVGE